MLLPILANFRIFKISSEHFEPEENPPKLQDFNEALEQLADAVLLRIHSIKHHTAASNLNKQQIGGEGSIAEVERTEECEMDYSGPILRRVSNLKRASEGMDECFDYFL